MRFKISGKIKVDELQEHFTTMIQLLKNYGIEELSGSNFYTNMMINGEEVYMGNAEGEPLEVITLGKKHPKKVAKRKNKALKDNIIEFPSNTSLTSAG